MTRESEKILKMVSAVLKNKDGEMLLLKRSESNKTFQGYWQLPEGKIEPGESPEEAMLREIDEETKLKVSNLKLNSIHVSQFNLSSTHYITVRLIFFMNFRGKIKLSEDHSEYRWLSKNGALRKKLLVGTKEILKTI